MFRNIYTPFLLLFIFSVSGCRKYVEITPKGKVVPSEVRDYRQLMNNTTSLLGTIGMTEYGTDDISFSGDAKFLTGITGVTANLYNFNDIIFQESETDNEWNNLYAQIYIANVVINGIPTAKGGAEADKNQLLGEALVLRASNYYYLVNQYAKVYTPASAAQDAGVPLLLKPDLDADLTRASVQKVYDQLIADLQQAEPLLAASQTNKYYASKASVYAYLARVYLIMGDFGKAAEQAGKALAVSSSLDNFNSYALTPNNIPLNPANPEIIQWRNASNAYGNFFLSNDLLALFQTGDIRKTLYFGDAMTLIGWPGFIYNGEYNSFNGGAKFMTRNVGPTIPEMMLIQSEQLARTGKNQEAFNILNNLRIKRFTAAGYSPLSYSTGMDALKIVLEERRRELFMRGSRWFDLRRLNKEPALAKTVVHGWSNGTSQQLEPGSVRYIMPIPPNVIALSTEITPNPR